ncbi:MAG: alpha/beta fold hydrolase [Streptosporangiales bacterium]|nr:alpha/beta fold hydrolase [Streptosporangiales bacterium]
MVMKRGSRSFGRITVPPFLGASAQPSQGPCWTCQTAVLLQRVTHDRLGVDRTVVLVGHSIGSFIVRVLASQWPDRVAGMVYVDGTVPEVFAPTST